MQSLQYAIEAVFQPTPNGRGAKFQPLLENSIQPFNPWATVDTDHIEIDAVAAFQICTGVQVAHKSLKVDAIGAWHHNQARRVFMIRLIPKVRNHRQFFCLHLLRNLLQHLRS